MTDHSFNLILNVNLILKQLSNKTACKYKPAVSPNVSFNNAEEMLFHSQLSKYVNRFNSLPLQDYTLYVLQIYNQVSH